jgi:sugar-specific transcriptional regulator TrmB
MKNLHQASTGLQDSAKNKTHAEAQAAGIAKGVFDAASANAKNEKKQAMNDFNKYLSNLQSASPAQSWENSYRTVKGQARYLDKLDHKEKKDARKRLHSKHASQKSEVKGTYYEAYRAASNLLRDRNRLQNAMRRAGAKERDYEAEEEKNEALGESSQDKAEDLHDTATDATEDIYERAEEKLDGLQHASRKDQHAASQERHRQVQDALKTFKNAAKKTEKQSEKTYTKATQKKGDAIEGTEGSEENESGLEQIQKQMKSLQKGIPTAAAVASQELLDAPVDFSSLCLLTAASVAFLVFFYVRRTRPNPVAPPLLG